MCLGLARDLARAWTRSVGDSVVVFFLLTPSSPPSLSSVRLISVLFVKRICLTHSDVAQIITLSAGGHIDTVKRSQWTDVHYELDTIDRANISVIGFDFFFFFADSENQRKKTWPIYLYQNYMSRLMHDYMGIYNLADKILDSCPLYGNTQRNASLHFSPRVLTTSFHWLLNVYYHYWHFSDSLL